MSHSDIIQDFLARRSAPQWKHRMQKAPAPLLPAGSRKTGGTMSSRQVKLEPYGASNNFAAQPATRFAPYPVQGTHGMGNMWAVDDGEPNNSPTTLSHLEEMVVHLATDMQSIHQRLNELLEYKKENKEKMQEIRNTIKQLAEMYPMTEQDTVDPSLTFPPLPSA